MNIQQIIDILSNLAKQASQAIEKKMTTEDLTNPDAMVKVQFAVQQYTNYLNFESGLIKTIKDMISGIISKI